MLNYTFSAGAFLGGFSKNLFTLGPGPPGIISQDLFKDLLCV